MIVDPIVHGVAGNELDAGHRLADAALEYGIDVGEKKKLGVGIRRRNLGLEGGEDVEFGGVGLGFVQVVEVGPFPEEAFAGGAFDSLNVDVAFEEDGFLAAAKVFADDRNDADIDKETGGKGEVSGGAAQAAVTAAGGCFDGIVGNAAYYGDCHYWVLVR